MVKVGKEKRFIRLYMPNGGEDGVIIAILNDVERVEFRGAPYSQWNKNESSPMYSLHSSIKQVNISNLHCNIIETLTPEHDEWNKIYQMVQNALNYHY